MIITEADVIKEMKFKQRRLKLYMKGWNDALDKVLSLATEEEVNNEKCVCPSADGCKKPGR